MTFIEQLKEIYDRMPRPHHLAVSKARYDEAARKLQPPENLAHIPSIFDLKIYADDAVPQNEILAYFIETVAGERHLRIDKIAIDPTEEEVAKRCRSVLGAGAGV